MMTTTTACHSNYFVNISVGVDGFEEGTSLPAGLNGCHFEPLNHQLYVLYSQRIYDESFESILNLNASLSSHPEYAGNGWLNYTLSSTTEIESASFSSVELVVDGGVAFNGEVAARLVGDGATLVNRGLYHEGWMLAPNSQYEGYFYILAEEEEDSLLPPPRVVVRLENAHVLDFDRPLAVLDEVSIPLSGGGGWRRYDFVLDTGANGTTCGAFPVETEPLQCNNSTEEYDICSQCNGQLAISLAVDGDGSGKSVLVDQVFLHAADGRFSSLPVQAEPVEWMLSMGVKALRYGGSSSKTAGYLWKRFRGERAFRQPYRGAWDPVQGTTAGFGMFELLDLCDSAGIEDCIITFNLNESPQDMGDFVEYIWGDDTTEWGRLRAADGRADTYRLRSVHIGNEQPSIELVDTFAAIVEAMEVRASSLGRGGELIYIAGSDKLSDGGSSVVSDGNTSVVLQQVAHRCHQIGFDWHVTPHATPSGADPFNLDAMQNLMAENWPKGCDGGAGIYVLEENLCNAHFARALADAGTANTLQRWAPFVRVQTTSQCWTAAGHPTNCGEGHIYVTNNQTWGPPPFYANQMLMQSWQPKPLPIEMTIAEMTLGDGETAANCERGKKEEEEEAPILNMFAAGTGGAHDGGQEGAVLRVVNANNFSIDSTIRLYHNDSSRGGWPSTATLQLLTSPLSGTAEFAALDGGVNPIGDPTYISTQVSQLPCAADVGTCDFTFPAQSFAVLEWKLEKTKV